MPQQLAGADRDPSAESPESTPNLVLRSQYLKDLSFENLAPPAGMGRAATPRGEASIDVDFDHLDGGLYEVRLRIKVEATVDGRGAYVVEALYAGQFEVREPGATNLQRALLVKAPSLLFPFARALIYAMTLEGGYPALMINPVDFRTVARARKRAARALNEAGAKSDS